MNEVSTEQNWHFHTKVICVKSFFFPSITTPPLDLGFWPGLCRPMRMVISGKFR